MKTIHSNIQLLGQSLLALSAATSASAMAQRESIVLEEVVVTAEHRESTLQETEISMSAFDAKAITERGISNSLDLGQSAPNVNVQPYVGGKTGVSFNIRGIGNAETLISFDPAVSVYLDGVLIAKNTGALLDVLELERIEILRGPQGTLYGRNTMGGAVNFITLKPVDEFEGSLEATLGNYDQRDLRGMLNLPLLDADSAVGELNARVSAATLNRDGLQDNVFANASQDELGTTDRQVVMSQLQWRPVDALSVLYTYDRTRIDEIPEAPWVTNANLGTFFGGLLAPYVVDKNNRPDDIALNHVGIAETEVDGHALNIEWDLADNLSLQSLTGYREMFNFSQADSDGAPIGATFPTPPIPPALSTRDVQENESFSQEVRLIGSAGRTEYSMGLFYMDEQGDVFNETTAAGSPGVSVAEYENKAWAVFGQGTYALTDRLDLTMGARYTEEDRVMSKGYASGRTFISPIGLDDFRADPTLTPLVTLPNGTVTGLYPEASNDFDNISWLVSLGYDWTDDVMTYAKISTGYQSGGFNSRDGNPTDFVIGFEEETLLAYEIGVKSRWANRFQVNAAAFFSDYDDKRVNQFNQETLASVQRNAGVVEIWGVEFEMLAQLTDHLQAGVNYGHVDHKYVEYAVLNPDGTISDLSGVSNFPYSPENTASANLAYEHPLSFGVLQARVDWSYRDEMTFLVPQPERNSASDVQLWNARLTVGDIQGLGDSRMRVSLWGKNLTDESYYNFGVNVFDSFGFDINTYGAPRTYGVEFEIDF